MTFIFSGVTLRDEVLHKFLAGRAVKVEVAIAGSAMKDI
jgi:hypothetical protein